MNTLSDTQRERVLALLREGKSLRRIEHETGHRRETIAAYGRRAGLLPETVTKLHARKEAASALMLAA
jgi:DNA-binding CsgD family transcriptional regulator